MKLSLVFGLVLVSFVSALPRYPAPRSPAPTQSQTVSSESTRYNGLVHLANIALGLTFSASHQPGLSKQVLHVACGLGLSFNPHTKLCELPWSFVPDVSHSEGHGKCPTGQFWFGPRQKCIGGKDTKEIVDPPAGFYCPLDWNFSARYSCCVPNSSAALVQNSCNNGNGTWDLIRLACVESPTHEFR